MLLFTPTCVYIHVLQDIMVNSNFSTNVAAKLALEIGEMLIPNVQVSLGCIMNV